MLKSITLAFFAGLAACVASPFGQAAERGNAIVVKNAWLRATPNGATVAGGYATIVNAGPDADRLVAASLSIAPKGEVHRMSMENGVMHMSRLERGLEIAPGASVTLSPGGDHLMFLDPTTPLKQSETVKGSLTFEKAGTIPVTFDVAGMAAKTAPKGRGMDMEHTDMKDMDMGHIHDMGHMHDMGGMGH